MLVAPEPKAFWFPLLYIEVAAAGAQGAFQFPGKDGSLRPWRYPRWAMSAYEVDLCPSVLPRNRPSVNDSRSAGVVVPVCTDPCWFVFGEVLARSEASLTFWVSPLDTFCVVPGSVTWGANAPSPPVTRTENCQCET